MFEHLDGSVRMNSATNVFCSIRPDDGDVMAENFAKSSNLRYLYNGSFGSATMSIYFEVARLKKK